MSNITTDLKTWGSTGELWPDGYYFTGDAPPYFEFLNKHLYETGRLAKKHTEVLNGRLESGVDSSSYPGDPEDGQLSWRTDNTRLSIYDSSSTAWKGLSYKSELDGHRSAGNPHSVGLEKARTVNNTLEGNVNNTGGTFQVNGNDVATESWVNTNAPPAVDISEDGTKVLQKAEDIDFLGNLSVVDQGDGTVTVDDSHNHDTRYYTQSEVDSIAADSPNEASYVEVRTSDPSTPDDGRMWLIQ